jgi:hypothetical protein
MIIKSKKQMVGDIKWEPIAAETLDPTYSVIFFYIYPAVAAGFVFFEDAEKFCDAQAETYPSPGCWCVIQTGEEY